MMNDRPRIGEIKLIESSSREEMQDQINYYLQTRQWKLIDSVTRSKRFFSSSFNATLERTKYPNDCKIGSGAFSVKGEKEIWAETVWSSFIRTDYNPGYNELGIFPPSFLTGQLCIKISEKSLSNVSLVTEKFLFNSQIQKEESPYGYYPMQTDIHYAGNIFERCFVIETKKDTYTGDSYFIISFDQYWKKDDLEQERKELEQLRGKE